MEKTLNEKLINKMVENLNHAFHEKYPWKYFKIKIAQSKTKTIFKKTSFDLSRRKINLKYSCFVTISISFLL